MSLNFQGKILVGDGDLVVNVDNQSYQVTKEHPKYVELFEAFKNNDAETFISLYEVTDCVEEYFQSKVSDESGVSVVGEKVFYNGVELCNAVVDTIRNMMHHGLDFDPMVRFLERAIKSNSSRVVNELFGFLQQCRCTITEDGCFLAYKTVRPNYYDKYSGSVLNVVGEDVRMPKWQVDDNCNNACSKGYHVGALAYAGPGGWYNSDGDKVMIVKVAPEDVVSVPNDHSCQKLRTCAYTVVGEFQGELQSGVYSGKVGDDYDTPVVPNHNVNMEIKPEQMVVDGLYTCDYTNAWNVGNKRYFVVTEKREDCVITELLYPEENEGETRRFNFDRMYNLRVWNGKYVEDDDDDDYDCDDDEDSECDDDDDCCCDDNMNRYW